MPIIEALLYGAVQGFTELLPISSSGYTLITAWALGWSAPPTSFVATTHLGSLLAMALFFRRDWLLIARTALRDRRIPLGGDDDLYSQDRLERRRRIGDERRRLGLPMGMRSRQLLLAVVVSTLPALVVGPIVYPNLSEDLFEATPVVGGMLIANGVILLSAFYFNNARLRGDDRRPRASRVTGTDALIIGIGQAIALVPGISRSASTIAAGISRGMPTVVAVRYSFLIAAPAIVGAMLYSVTDAAISSTWSASDIGSYVIGAATAFGVSYAALYLFIWTLRTLGAETFLAFAALTASTGALALAFSNLG